MLKKASSNKECIVQVSNISKSYGRKEVLSNISFNIYTGDKVYLQGNNGVGKTTTLKILAGLLHADSGNVLYDGKSLYDHPYLRKHVGYMTTEPMFYEMLSVEDNLLLIGALYKIPYLKQRVNHVIQEFQMEHYRSELLSEISSGMKRKFQIAASIIHEPKLLILDEPFNTLDTDTIEFIKKIIKRNTVIFTTHDKTLGSAISTRKLLIHNNKLEELVI